MADSRFIPEGGRDPAWVLQREKHLLLKHYDFVNVQISGRTLQCTGRCQPSALSIGYTYRIKYTVDRAPVVHALNPVLAYDEHIHMYKEDNSLCLYYPADYSWRSDSSLYNTIVPWTHEWFLYYELYRLFGKWLYPAALHGRPT